MCWLCDRPVTGIKVIFRVLEPAVLMEACDEHATELVLAS